MRLAWLSLAALGAAVGWSTPARACGPTETVLDGLLPRPDQVDVPTDAVLWATGNHFELELRLRKAATSADPSGTDGGVAVNEPEEVVVETTCLPLHDRRLCRGRALLEANTQYEWLVVGTQGDVEIGAEEERPWQSFTTGEQEAETSTPNVEITVADNVVHEFYGCGGEAQVVTLRFDATALEQPLIVAADMSLDYPYTWARLIEPGSAEQTLPYLPTADCADVMAYDLSGAEYPLRVICFDEELEPTYQYTNGTRVPLSDVNGDSSEDTPANTPDDDNGTPGVNPPVTNDAEPTPTDGDEMVPSTNGDDPSEGQVIGTNRVDSGAGAGCTLTTSPARLHAGVLGLLGLGILCRRRRGRGSGTVGA